MLLTALLACFSSLNSAHALTSNAILAREQILIMGIGLQPSPTYQAVPKNTVTAVKVLVAGSIAETDALPLLPADALVFAELRGPVFGTPVTLTARPNESIPIPPLALTGLYTLGNIRLVSNGQTLLQAVPDAVTIEVIDKVLVSQVTSRPLTTQEIKDKGIVIDETNFQVVNFTAAFGFTDKKVNIDFPMIIPVSTGPAAPPAVPPLQIPTLQPAAVPAPISDLPQLQFALQSPSVSVSGLLLRVEEDDESLRALNIPPIPGVIIIPGNIAYLNQFFNVLLMVSNVAPGNSNLVVRDITAEIIIPPGNDTVVRTGDDPLRMARLGDPPVEQLQTQPVTRPGPDGKLGTADDIHSVAPGESGDAEFLVEGRKVGAHIVEMKITGFLYGLPVGPVKISGSAVGMVEVRNPTFALTLSHPSTVTAGEEYEFLVTVTNTSETPANFVSLNLLPRSISGATLAPGQAETIQVETIAAGDSETVTFRLIAQTTGTVTATSFASEDIPGKFEFRTAVGALGIPMSPNTLVLPTAADALPAALRNAGIGLLGQAYALATSPVTPRGLLPITQQIVFERATDLAGAGQRVGMEEPLSSVARDLALDFTGNSFTRIAERFDEPSRQDLTKADYRGFDELRRQSRRGAAFMQLLGTIFAGDVQSQSALSFQDSFTRSAASRPVHISAITGFGGGPAPVVLSITGQDSKRLGLLTAGEDIARDIPYGTFFNLIDSTPNFSQMGLISVPQAGTYIIEVTGTATGTFDLGLVVPEGNQLRRLTYPGVPIQTGGRARIVFTVGQSNTYTLEMDANSDSFFEQQIGSLVNEIVPDTGPAVISAVQVVTGKSDLSRFGQLIGLLFSEEISKASSQDGLELALLTHYQVEENQVLGSSLQPGGRVVLLSLLDGIGPFIPRTAMVTGIEDRLGNPMGPASITLPIMTCDTTDTATPDSHCILSNGGTVSGDVKHGDGTPVPHARIQLSQDLGFGLYTTITVKDADASGRYTFDYITDLPSRFEALDLESGEKGEARTQVRYNGQHLDLDIILLGTGRLVGRVLAQDGTTTLPGAVVRVSSLTRFGDFFSAVADNSGVFSISGIPVGNITIEAADAATQSKTLLASTIPTAGGTVIQDLILLPLAQAEIQTGALKGQVFRSDGMTPAMGIPVYTTRGGLATTDASGSYRIEGIPEGPIEIRAIDQALLEQGTIATTIVGGQEITANLILFGGTGTVRGVVLDADGNPVAGAIVGGGLSLVLTDANGQFILNDVPVGQRTMNALDEVRQLTGSVSVNLATPGEEVTVQLILEARGTLAGQVFEADGKTPVSDLRIFLLGPRNLITITDFNGGYRFENIPLGSYMVSAFRTDFSDGNIAQAKLVFKDEVRRQDVIFRGKGRVTGIVLDDDGVTPLGATVGFSELQVKTGVLRPPENTNCFSNIQVGDEVVELPQCIPVGIGFESSRLTRIIQNDISSGTFEFDNVFVGGFTIEAANPFSPTIMAASGMIPKAGDTAYVVLQLVGTGVVKGTVYQPDGITPVGKDVVVTFNSGTLQNVKVVTCDATDGNPDPPCAPGEKGKYLFPLINAGAFTVTAEDPVTGLVGQGQGTVEAGRTAEIPIRLLGKGTVTVEVMGSNGLIEGAQVTLQRWTFPNDQRQRVTGSDGRTSFEGGDSITEGPFSVSAFDLATGVRGFNSGLLPGPDIHVDIRITLPDEAGTVRGRFLKTDGVTGIPNAQIRLISSRGEAFTTADSQGDFVLEGVPIGGFTVEASGPATARRGRSTGQVSVNHEDVTVDIIEVPQGIVKGFARLSKGLIPVAGAEVSISMFSTFGGQLRTTSGVDGAFTFPGVSAGNFSLSARDPLTGVSGGASGVLVSEGEEVDLDIILQVPQVGRVEGFVKKADGSPGQGAQVTLNNGLKTTADNSGFYFFENVPVGSVSLLATAFVGNDAGISSGQVAFDGDVERVDIQFIGTGSVTGTVTTALGEVAPFARVVLTRKTTIPKSFFAETQTDLNGRFQFDGVLVGDMSVTATQSVTQLAGTASGTLASDGATLDLSVVLEPSAEMTGRVLREDGLTPAGGMALELVNGSKRFGSTSADGAFRFADLSLGTYKLTVTDPLGTGLVRATAVLNTEGQVMDLGDLILDESLPRIVSITPANGTINVPVSQIIEVQFSEPVDPATVTASNLVVSGAAGLISGTWEQSQDLKRAFFTPSVAYRDFAQIHVKVTTRVKDLVGKSLMEEIVSSFITADSTPPATQSVSPATGARDVPLESVVRVAYSEAIDPTKFTGPAIVLSLNGSAVAGRLDFILNNTAIVFTPNARLFPNAIYQVSIQPATDIFGNSQALGTVYTLNTLDTEPPEIHGLNIPGGTSVFEGTTATVEADLGLATDVAFVEFLVNGQLVQTDRSDPYALSLPVTTSLGATVTVAARATDLTGNTGQEKSISLTVQSDAPPVAMITSPAEGGVVNSGSRVTVSVHAADDFGVAQVVLQTTGVVNISSAQSVTPATPSHDAIFNMDIPSTASPGSTIVLKVTAIDTLNKPGAIGSISLLVGDATPPTVQITSPLIGSKVSPGETVNVLVSATDNGAVSSIGLQTSGVTSFAESRTVSPPAGNVATTFQAIIPATATGKETLVLTAQAQDSAGNVIQTSPLTLSVRDLLSPAVTLAVKDGVTEIIPGRSVTVTVSASDEVGVAGLGFQTGGAFVATGSQAVEPAQPSASADFVIAVPSTAQVGSLLTITGTAKDGENNTGTSAALSLAVVLEPMGTVIASVNFASGVAAPNTLVSIRKFGQTDFAVAGRSDDSGVLTIPNVPEGDFTLRAFHPDNANLFGEAAGAIMADGEVVSTTVTLPAAGRVEGRVLLDGTSVADIPVNLQALGGHSFNTISDAGGNYIFTGIPVGAITVKAADLSNRLSGQATGNLAADGETLTLNVALLITFDATTDFSQIQNPNGPWSYGASTTLGSIILYTVGDKLGSLDRWHMAPGIPEVFNAPLVFYNGNQLGSHPGPNGEFSIIRWTAPATGVYRINVDFIGGDSGSTDVHLLKGTDEIFSAIVTGLGDIKSSMTDVMVFAGETIDFAVGANGSFFNDTRLINATISAIPLSADSDGDGVSNSDEINLYGTHPLNPDTDSDGLTDSEEINLLGTDPLSNDTDGGGRTDGQEVQVDGTDPLNPADDILQVILPKIFFGPRPYRSTGDSPFDLSRLGIDLFLDNFEDGLLNTPGVTASNGGVIPPTFENFIDSVDADDGTINGSGSGGHSFHYANGAEGITFTFDATVLGALPTCAGIVWTDGFGTTTFEVFDGNGLSLGTMGPLTIADGSVSGTTSEDRFFGIFNSGGISAIKISNTSAAIETDHLQYGRCAAVTFDASKDFSLASNPNGPWSYGASATLGSITLYTVADRPSGLDRWHTAPGIPESSGAPAFIYNGTTGNISIVPPGQLGFHPGQNGEFSVIRFTAPGAGTYQVNVTFRGGDTATTDVHVLKGTEALFSGDINGQGDAETFNGAVTLATGETIEFAVGYGGNGFFFDTTFINATVTLQTGGGCVPPPTGLISWWPGEGNANDISGANHGMLQNGVNFATGEVGEAFNLDGVNDFVQVPDSNLWAFGASDFTIDLWANFKAVRPGDVGSAPNVFIGQDEGPGFINKWVFFLGGGGLTFHINGPVVGLAWVGPIPFSPVTGRWYHLAMTRSGSTYTFFVDGTPIGTATDSRDVPDASAPLTIGQIEGLGFFNGRIDEVEIYNRALSASEIQAIFNAGSSGKCIPGVTRVYSNDFERGDGSGWSSTLISTTPAGARKFLGEFGTGTVSLRLGALPVHTSIDVAFDLFVLKSWDGNSCAGGCPETWSLSADNTVLLNTTFSNYTTQAYPGSVGVSNPARTGAVENNTLGYTHSFLGPADSVYHLSFSFPHSADSLILNFTGTGLQEIPDESWGLDNVTITFK